MGLSSISLLSHEFFCQHSQLQQEPYPSASPIPIPFSLPFQKSLSPGHIHYPLFPRSPSGTLSSFNSLIPLPSFLHLSILHHSIEFLSNSLPNFPHLCHLCHSSKSPHRRGRHQKSHSCPCYSFLFPAFQIQRIITDAD